MAKRRGLAGQTFHTLATLLAGQGAQIAAGIAIARAFGPAGKGIVSYAGILIMFALSAADGIKAAIAYQAGAGARSPRSVHGAALIAAGAAALTGTAAFAALAVLYPQQPAYAAVACAFGFALYMHTVSQHYLMAGQVEQVNSRIMLTAGAGGSLAMLAATILGAPLPVVLGIWVLSFVAGAIANGVGLRRITGGAPAFDDAPLIREHATFGAKAALGSFVTLLAQRVDVLIVGALLSPAALGIYTLGLAAGESAWQFSKSLWWSASGRIATEPRADAAALTARVVRTTLAVQAAIAAVLFVAGPWLVVALYGARFAEAGVVLRIVLPGIALYAADGVLRTFITVRDARPAFVTWVECANLVVCAVLTVATIGRYGIEGAAVATTVAYAGAFLVKAWAFSSSTGIAMHELFVPRLGEVAAAVRAPLGRLRARTP